MKKFVNKFSEISGKIGINFSGKFPEISELATLLTSIQDIGELPKLCEKISIADWYVAHSFPHSWRHGGHNEKGQSTNQLSGRGLVLVQPMDIVWVHSFIGPDF